MCFPAEAAARGEWIEYRGRDRDPRYRYEDSTSVEMLAVTEDEMRAFPVHHLVTSEIKRERDESGKSPNSGPTELCRVRPISLTACHGRV